MLAVRNGQARVPAFSPAAFPGDELTWLVACMNGRERRGVTCLEGSVQLLKRSPLSIQHSPAA